MEEDVDKSKVVNKEVAEKIKKLPKQTKYDFAKNDKIYEANIKKIEKAYSTVVDQECWDLGDSTLQWLKHRLPMVKKDWENSINIDAKECPKQFIEYTNLCELIELTDYIIGCKWEDAFDNEDDGNPFDWDNDLKYRKLENGGSLMLNERHLAEMLKEDITPERKSQILARISYLRKSAANTWGRLYLEDQKRNRWIELFSSLIWRLGT